MGVHVVENQVSIILYLTPLRQGLSLNLKFTVYQGQGQGFRVRVRVRIGLGLGVRGQGQIKLKKSSLFTLCCLLRGLGIYLFYLCPLPNQCWGYRYSSHAQLLHGFLGFEFRSSGLYSKNLHTLNQLLSPKFYLKEKKNGKTQHEPFFHLNSFISFFPTSV